jgi:hypothetical protein
LKGFQRHVPPCLQRCKSSRLKKTIGSTTDARRRRRLKAWNFEGKTNVRTTKTATEVNSDKTQLRAVSIG